jgi:hypothetical protein
MPCGSGCPSATCAVDVRRKPTAADDRWTQVAHPVTAGRLKSDRRGDRLPADLADDSVLIDAGAIAPLHKACVDRSLRYCPHLKADPDIDVALPRSVGRPAAHHPRRGGSTCSSRAPLPPGRRP